MSPTIQIGAWRVTCLRDTPFWVDGGTIFHMVPKVRWSKKVEPDSENRLPVALNCLLLQKDEHTILVDAGIGADYSPKMETIYKLDRSVSLMKDLASAGVSPDDITTVILTHLHLDHTGWCMHTPDGERQITFKNARHVVQQKEWHGALHGNELTAGSYLEDDFLPLQEAGLVDFVDGDTELLPDLTLHLTGAHAPGHQMLRLTSEGTTLLCPGEIIPDRHHLPLPWVMSYDDEPVQVVEVKRKILTEALETGATVFLMHEGGPPFGHIQGTLRKPVFASV